MARVEVEFRHKSIFPLLQPVEKKWDKKRRTEFITVSGKQRTFSMGPDFGHVQMTELDGSIVIECSAVYKAVEVQDGQEIESDFPSRRLSELDEKIKLVRADRRKIIQIKLIEKRPAVYLNRK